MINKIERKTEGNERDTVSSEPVWLTKTGKNSFLNELYPTGDAKSIISGSSTFEVVAKIDDETT